LTYLRKTLLPVAISGLPGLVAGLLANALWHAPLLDAAVALAVYGAVYSRVGGWALR
jgi:hypothetical protein